MEKAQDPGKVGDVDHRLLDGYDGGSSPPSEFIQQMLKSAPPEVQKRAAEWAEQRGKLEAAEPAEGAKGA